jgi:C4-dicarboxylate-specific signal transduction histidine kinase
MKIILQKKKLILWLCLVFTMVFIGLMSFVVYAQRQNSINGHKESLQILANEKAAQVNTFLESQKENQKILASMNVFKEVALYPNDSVKIAIAKDRIRELKDTIPGIGILSKEGIVIIAENNPVGTDYSMMPMFPVDDKTGITFMRYYDLQRKKDYFGVIGPIYDGTKKNKVIGVIGFDIELEKVSTLMKETVESGTNEVYLIDETGLLLSNSKYVGSGDKKGVLIQEVKNDESDTCLGDLKKYQKDGVIEKHEEKILSYLNYMGNEVFGAHAYVPAIMACIIAEESAKKVLGIFDVKLY